MEGKKNMLKRWKLCGIIVVIILIIVGITIFILKNKLTPEETVSKFMYLIENKQYEEAKKLCSENLERLDILSNIKPSNLKFEYSYDKKNATAVLLEDEIEITNINIVLKNTILGWNINNYEIITDLIDPQVIENRLKNKKNVTDIQLLYWAESDFASKNEIAEYAKDNSMIALIFAQTMKKKNYNKAIEMYQPTGEKDITIEQLKTYNWDNYEVIDSFKILEGPKGDFNSITVKLNDKKLWIYVAGKIIITITEATT